MRKFEGYMHGVDLGGWLSQKDSDTKEYMDTFITEDDFRRIADMGLDHVRIPVDYTTIEDEEDARPIENGYKHLDDAVSWCRKYGLHMIVDLHNTHGYTFDPLVKDMDRTYFFHNEKEQERFYALWQRIVKRYAKDTDIVAFELLNEVVLPEIAEDWNNIADEAVKRMREIVPDAWIIIGGVNYNNVTDVPKIHKPADEHIVFNFHCYEPLIFTHQNAYWVEKMPRNLHVTYPDTIASYRKIGEDNNIPIEALGAMGVSADDLKGKQIFERLFESAIETAEKYNVPLYCGEYGVIDNAPKPDTLRWIQDITSVFDEHGIGRALWNYKAKDYGLVDSAYDDIRDEMVKVM